MILVLIIIIINITKYQKELKYIFNKFLLERYTYSFNIKKIKYINGLNLKKMHRNYRHVFITKNNCYTEREIIRKKFDLQGKVW